MKKLFMLFALVIGLSTISFSSNSYVVDDSKIESMFAQANECSVTCVSDIASIVTPVNVKLDDRTTALISMVVLWFLGGLGIHRYVLGTKASMWAIYCFTLGGIFGIVPLVDFFVLLFKGVIKGDISDLKDNEKFMMWSGK